MDHKFWTDRWKEGRIGFHREEANRALVKHWGALGVPADRQVFVPLCGKSLDMVWLNRRGHDVFGVELSPLAVEAFFAENFDRHSAEGQTQSGEGIQVRCGDFFDVTREDLADVGGIYDRGSLIALPPELRQRYAEHLQAVAPPKVPILLLAVEYDQSQMGGPPFSVPSAEIEELFGGRYRCEELERRDVLEQEERFKKRGVTRLHEVTWRLA